MKTEITENGILIEKRELSDLELIIWNEAVVNFYYGMMRQGKTYGATADAINDLNEGNVVYTSWKINWEGFDERNSKWNLFLGRLGLKKEFRHCPKENWHYLPYEGVEDKNTEAQLYYPYDNFIDKFLSLTDCKIYLDEAQKVFSSYERTKITEAKQDAIIFTGHFNRSISLIAQRVIQIHPIMRVNISRFYKFQKEEGFFGGITFTRSEYQKTDANGIPDEREEPIEIKEYSFDKKIGNAYNSKYMRGSIKPSQENKTEILSLSKVEIKKLMKK